jgi:protein-tyrosine-phosphatase
MSTRPCTTLVLYTGNACRSQMTEVLLNQLELQARVA